jgi:hypothetical protein
MPAAEAVARGVLLGICLPLLPWLALLASAGVVASNRICCGLRPAVARAPAGFAALVASRENMVDGGVS